jgi:hypothetical protein
MGRLASYAATFAGIMAGGWVAGLVAAAVSVRLLATALVVLRGALIRTGVGALIVAAGELVYQFGRLVAGACGFGNAMSLLGEVASEVWERIKSGGQSLALSLKSVWARIESGWLTALSSIQRSWADFLHAVTSGMDAVPGMEDATLALSEAAIRAGSAFYDTAAPPAVDRRVLDGQNDSSLLEARSRPPAVMADAIPTGMRWRRAMVSAPCACMLTAILVGSPGAGGGKDVVPDES